MKISAIVQIRMGSTRLPKKTFLKLAGFPLIHHAISRLKPSKLINEVIIATTKNNEDDEIEIWCKNHKIKCFRGSENNVLKRYYDCAEKYNSDYIVRITGDDPFKDYRIIDKAVEIISSNKYDFVCNNSPASYPEGLDVEVFTKDTLIKIYENATSDQEKEHVTLYVHNNKSLFKTFNMKNSEDLSNYRWTIDYEEDYIFAKKIYDKLYFKKNIFLTEDIYKILKENSSLLSINNNQKKSILYEK